MIDKFERLMMKLEYIVNNGCGDNKISYSELLKMMNDVLKYEEHIEKNMQELDREVLGDLG